jgi:hypothetical protein
MTLHRAAALSLLGWYLMLPKLVTTQALGKPPKADSQSIASAPISRWQVIRSFDFSSDCEDARAKLRDSLLGEDKMKELEKQGYEERELRRRAELLTCIATDDPRLREKP